MTGAIAATGSFSLIGRGRRPKFGQERVELDEVSSIIKAHLRIIMVEETDGDSVQFAVTLPAIDRSTK